MEDRIELFDFEGKQFIYFDVSYFKNNAQFKEFIEYAKKIIRQRPAEGSLFSVTNIEGILSDRETQALISEWMEFNRPYIKQGAGIGLGGIKRIMVNALLKMGGGNTMKFFRTRDEAVQWLAAQ
ncbi:MAG: hypothetical protein LBL19_01335 [Spirochaetaceae bacterium]|jgi:hypothetical protein|nr:hypothetical protein [Spirochaetaceae bacterium]